MKIYRILIFYTLSIVANANAYQINNIEGKTDSIIVLNDDASWCWFQDDRAIFDDDQLLFSAVTSEGANTVTSYNMKTQRLETVILNDSTFKPDDHNVGVLFVRPDGRYLSVYAGHNVEEKMRYRISTYPGDICHWEPEKSVYTGAKTSYSNVYRLSSTGKTYSFHRGIGFNPNYVVSEDDGTTWQYGGKLMAFDGRPYVRYASNNIDRIHFITTEDHPRHYNNSIYHGYIEGEYIYGSDGQKLGPLSKSENTDFKPQSFTRVFNGNSSTRTDVAWTSDIELDKNGYPYIAFSVTKDPIALGELTETEIGGFDHRYHYARWDGKQWHEHEIAYAGSRLYAGENEYTGLIALHPENPNVVYISADVNPDTGEPLNKDGDQHYEIFKGVTADWGANWKWTAITENSKHDNIRPIIIANDDYEAILWLNGRFTTFKDYDMKALGIIRER